MSHRTRTGIAFGAAAALTATALLAGPVAAQDETALVYAIDGEISALNNAADDVPTDEANDCTFCDFAAICRARRGAYSSVASPLTEWSKEHANTGMQPAFVQLKKSRTYED